MPLAVGPTPVKRDSAPTSKLAYRHLYALEPTSLIHLVSVYCYLRLLLRLLHWFVCLYQLARASRIYGSLRAQCQWFMCPYQLARGSRIYGSL